MDAKEKEKKNAQPSGPFTGTHRGPSTFTSPNANRGGIANIATKPAASGPMTSLVARTGSGLNHPRTLIFAIPLAIALPLSLLAATAPLSSLAAPAPLLSLAAPAPAPAARCA